MGYQEGGGGFGRGPRQMHKAICADCNKECEVPFKPSGDRPVYCRDCFSKRKQGDRYKVASQEVLTRTPEITSCVSTE